MSANTIIASSPLRLAAGVCGVMLALPAVARQNEVQGMQMPAQAAPSSSAPASASSAQSMQGMDMSSMPGMQREASMRPSQPAAVQHLDFGSMIGARPRPGGLAQGMQGMNMSSMEGMDMSSMQGGGAPPDARSPDYSDGYRPTSMPGMAMSDHAKAGMLLIDQLEYAYDDHGDNAAFLDAEAWYGEDFDKLWLKAEGESARGRLQDLRTEALWDHAVSAYWDTQFGVRHDFGEGPGRTWGAFGVQ